MVLTFINNVTKYSFDLAVNDFGDSRIYFHFRVQLPENLDDGEYSVRLYDDDKKECYWTGIAQIGNYVPENKKYNSGKSANKQYQPE